MLTAGDVFKKQIQEYKPVDYVMGKEVFRKRFSGQNKYHYCPFCIERLKRGGLDYKQELQPLWVVRLKNLYKVNEKLGQVIYETAWFCDTCKDSAGKAKQITTDDFLNFYAAEKSYTPSNKRFIDLTDINELKKF